MVPTEEKIEIKPALWNAAIFDDLSQDCDAFQLDYWYEEIYKKNAFCYEIFKDSERLGTLVISFQEWNDNAKEMHIGPLGGKYAEAFQAITPFLYTMAEKHQVDRVRVIAKRSALIRMLKPHGFDIEHYALVKPMRVA